MAKLRDRKIRLPLLYAGERATCYCCTDPLPIRLVGVDRDVAGQAWTASKALVQALYMDLSLPGVLDRRQACCGGCKRPIYDRKHYWLNRDPSDTEGRFLFGPCCAGCTQNFALRMEDQTGRSLPVVAYMVDFTPALARQLRADSELTPAEAASVDAEAWQIACDDDSPLF